MEYIVNDYIESGYFETSIVGIQAGGALVFSASLSVELLDISDGQNEYLDASYVLAGYFNAIFVESLAASVFSNVSLTAELTDISDGGNNYIDSTYLQPGYFEWVQSTPSTTKEANATISSNFNIVSSLGIIKQSGGAWTSAFPTINVIANRLKDINLYAFGNASVSTTANKISNAQSQLSSLITQSANAGKLVQAQTGIVNNEYIDNAYIQFGYFIASVDGGIVSVFNQSTQPTRIVQGKIGNTLPSYIDNNYIEGGYFAGGDSDLRIVFTLSGALELVETGFIEGGALLASVFTSLPVITRQRNGVASFATISNMAPVGFRTRENTASFEIQTQSQSTARRTRGISSSIETQSIISTINSRIRDNASTMSVQFQTTTFGQRGRGIDLYAFTNGALSAQASVIRNSNALANTFFNVGTDFIRTRNVSAEGDATVFISNIPTRIRASNIETQNAFSFASTANTTKRISQSLVASFNSDNQFSLTRGATANLAVNATLSITPNVTRAFDSAITSVSTQTAIPSVTRSFSSSQSVSTSIFCVISAIFGIDMIAYNFASMTALVGVRKRASSDIFSVPGFALRCDFARARTFNVAVQSSSSVQSTATRIQPFIANPYSSEFACQTTGVRVKGLFPRNMLAESNIIMVGVVRFYFFPTVFSFNVTDEPLANTLTSRTRETGVNI
jgi:hypothetical protein